MEAENRSDLIDIGRQESTLANRFALILNCLICRLAGSEKLEDMSIALPLQKMSAEEKIRITESIWDDLCDTAGSTLSPDWHGSVLADRKAAVLAGEDEIIDWEDAKRKISDELR